MSLTPKFLNIFFRRVLYRELAVKNTLISKENQAK